MKTTVYLSVAALVILACLQPTSQRLVTVKVPKKCIDQCTCKFGQKWISEDCSIEFLCLADNKVERRLFSCGSGKRCKTVGWKGKCVKDTRSVGYIHHYQKDCPDNDFAAYSGFSLEFCLRICDNTYQCVAVQYMGGECILKHKCDRVLFHGKLANIYEKESKGGLECLVGLDCSGNTSLNVDGLLVRMRKPWECEMQCKDNRKCDAYVTSSAGSCLLKSSCYGTELVTRQNHTVCIGICEKGPFGGKGGGPFSDKDKTVHGQIKGFIVAENGNEINCFGTFRENGEENCFGEEKGNVTKIRFTEDWEYITDINGRSDGPIINQLTITTSKGVTYGPYGGDVGKKFVANFNKGLAYISGRNGAQLDQLAFHYFC